jgi:hypothetical protein
MVFETGITTIQDLLVLIIFLLIAPFAVVGLYKLFQLIDTLFKVRRGFIKVWKLLPNDQITEFWSRSAGGKIRVKSSNPGSISDSSTLQVKLGKGWVWRKGNVPFIKLDKDNNQIQWEQNSISSDLPKEIVDEMNDTSFTAGTMVGFGQNKQLKFLTMLIVVALAVSAVGILLNYYLISNIHITTQTVAITGYNLTNNGIPVV